MRAVIAVLLRIVAIVTHGLRALPFLRATVANHAVRQAPLDQPVAQGGIFVACIQSHSFHFKAKGLDLSVPPGEIGNAVMDVARGDEAVGDDGVFGIDGAVVEVEEALGFAFAHHVAAVRVGSALLDNPGFFGRDGGLRLALLWLLRFYGGAGSLSMVQSIY